MKRSFTLIAVALAVALAGAVAGASGKAHDTTLSVTEVPTGPPHVVNNTITLTGTDVQHGRAIGRGQAACFQTGPRDALCTGTTVVPHGTINGVGVINETPGKTSTIGIAGGTGA
jgi:hypothetical protein